MLKLILKLPKNPTGTSQQKGLSNGHIYTKPEVTRQRNIYQVAIGKALKEEAKAKGIQILRTIPFDGPVSIRIIFHFAVKDRKKWGKYKPSAPDLDNVEKLLLDAMTDCGIWNDDRQVVMKYSEKVYSEEPCIEIIVGEVREEVEQS